MDLAGIGRLRGLDKIPDKTGSCTVLGANGTMDRHWVKRNVRPHQKLYIMMIRYLFAYC